MRIGKHREDDILFGVERQKGCSQGWFMSLVRCPECRKVMWSNTKELHCPTCNISKEIKK